jgi:hypothetical protein
MLSKKLVWKKKIHANSSRQVYLILFPHSSSQPKNKMVALAITLDFYDFGYYCVIVKTMFAEMMRQAAVGSKTSSPKDRALGRQRERTRFASPSK